MLSKFVVIAVFNTKYNKKGPQALFGPFWKNLLQGVTNRESFKNFKIIIRTCYRRILQSMTVTIKCDQTLLQSVTGITKCDKRLS